MFRTEKYFKVARLGPCIRSPKYWRNYRVHRKQATENRWVILHQSQYEKLCGRPSQYVPAPSKW